MPKNATEAPATSQATRRDTSKLVKPHHSRKEAQAVVDRLIEAYPDPDERRDAVLRRMLTTRKEVAKGKGRVERKRSSAEKSLPKITT